MAYDEGLAQRIRESLGDRPDLTEKAMFGGIGFMLRGNMCVGVIGNELLVRVGPKAHDDAVKLPHARIFDFTKRPSKGWIYVAPAGVSSDADLHRWADRGVTFAMSLPAK